MRRAALFIAMLCCLAGVASASDIDDVKAAAQKLADAGNYSWKVTNETPGTPDSGNVQMGRTDKDGTTVMKMNVAGSDVVFFCRGEKFVFKMVDRWMTAAEIDQDPEQKSVNRLYQSIAQNFKPPANMISSALSKRTEVRKEADAYTSELTGDEAKKIILGGAGRRGAHANAPYDVKSAKIVSTVWIKDGLIVKDVTRTIATLTTNGEDRNIDRLTTVEFTDIGSTKVDVPADAKKKLE